MTTTQDKLERLLRHIKNVQENCEVIGKKLIEAGEVDFGVQLIANGLIHDRSKFDGIEWLYLHQTDDKEKLDYAIAQHNLTNKHHPEAWNGIKNMPRLYVAEMVCDWAARSAEFGQSLQDWVDGGAMKRFAYNKNMKVYRDIMFFVKLLIEQPFKQK